MLANSLLVIIYTYTNKPNDTFGPSDAIRARGVQYNVHYCLCNVYCKLTQVNIRMSCFIVTCAGLIRNCNIKY